MTRQQIETRIAIVQKRLTETRHVEDLKVLNAMLEKLILMEASDD